VLPRSDPPIVSLSPCVSRQSFVYAAFQVSFCAYMFGWHVHEKAILTSILLLTPLALEDEQHGRSTCLTRRKK
jgi:hypothetical protein